MAGEGWFGLLLLLLLLLELLCCGCRGAFWLLGLELGLLMAGRRLTIN
jgi:hypothetical protein